jgi:SARP family transcriptional regulator, regulator of embCAB operon
LVDGPRIYLTGAIAIQNGNQVAGSEQFPGRQGRLAFAYLTLEHRRVVLRSELADLLWPEEWPRAPDTALNAILSKLRHVLAVAGMDGSSLVSGAGWYQLRIPADVWIDVEAALVGLHVAEGAVRAGNIQAAFGHAGLAYQITRRPFAPGEECEWVQGRRRQLRDAHLRSMECLSRIHIANGEPAIAADLCRRAIETEPFRETAYQLLMRAHAAAGNRAEALRTYEQCRRLLAEELGADPSRETQAVHLELLGAT